MSFIEIQKQFTRLFAKLVGELNPALSPEEFIDVSASGDAEKQARLAELKKKLNESMMKLSDQHRAVVTLFDIQGLSHAEISKIMDCKEETVRSRLFYAHKQLQKYLKNYI